MSWHGATLEKRLAIWAQLPDKSATSNRIKDGVCSLLLTVATKFTIGRSFSTAVAVSRMLACVASEHTQRVFEHSSLTGVYVVTSPFASVGIMLGHVTDWGLRQ